MTVSKRHTLVAIGCATSLLVLGACSGGAGSDEETTIHVALGGSGDNHNPPADNFMTNHLGEAIGAKVVHETSPEDLAASLAAGDSPDVFKVTRNQLHTYVEQGLVLDLSPYQDKLGDYKDFVGESTVQHGMVDGKLTAITPYQNNNNDPTYWIRQDWLDELGLEIPTNAEEFREVLRAFTEDDPDGNGKDDTVGLTGASPDNTFNPLWGAFGTPGPGKVYVDDSGEVHDSYQDEGMAEAVKYIADLQASGFIDPDSYSLKALEARDRGFQGKAGVMNMSWTAVVKEPSAGQGKAANPDAEWAQVDQLEQADGSPGMVGVATGAASMYALPATLADDEEKVQKIIDLINYVSTPEGNRFAMWGEEGTHYETDDEGNITPLPGRAEEENGLFFIFLLSGREEQPYLDALFPELEEYITKAHDQPTLTTWEKYIVNPDDYNQADADQYAQDQLVQLLTGKQPATGYGDFVNTLDGDFGYATFIDAAREQLADVDTDG